MPLSFVGEAASKPDGPASRREAADEAAEEEEPAGAASAATKERALFKPLKMAVLEPPRHIQLADDTGRPIDRGSHVIIKSVLEPEAPGGEVRYTVKMNRGDAQMLKPVWWERVVPEGWLRGKGVLATSQSVDYTPLAPLLRRATTSGGLVIPLFQRRYCWSERQWEPLWVHSTGLVRQGEGSEHSLKRLMCLERGGAGGSLVLDGQQRLTTCCVLLASLRDAARTDPLLLPPLAEQITALLALAPPRADGWPHVLSPTLDDRENFAEALRPQLPPPLTASAEAGPLVRCRAFFSARCATLGCSDELGALGAAVMEGLHLIHFPISGSVQMQAVFEAHATKAQAQAAGELHFARAVSEVYFPSPSL